MFNSPKSIHGALERLAALMEETSCPPVGLLVCGGSALNVLGLVNRSTRDVDAICLVKDENGVIQFVKQDSLPYNLPTLVDRVAQDLNLPMTTPDGTPLPDDQKWINLGPNRLLELGLPEGIEGRLVKMSYETRLTAYFIGREDQIPLKLYASLLSDRAAVHQLDLVKLKASVDEIREATRWILSRQISPKHRSKLREVLFELEYGELIPEFYPQP